MSDYHSVPRLYSLIFVLHLPKNPAKSHYFDTWDQNLAVRGAITTKCGFVWSSRKVRSVMEHRVAQWASELAHPCREIGIWQFVGLPEVDSSGFRPRGDDNCTPWNRLNVRNTELRT
jgi:hypothetical protein